jgi:hypothetical protein
VTWHQWVSRHRYPTEKSVILTISSVWGYIKSRETARRMDAYAGEVTGMHPFYAYDSPARALDMDLATTNAYAGPNHITAGIQHGSWSMALGAGDPPKPNMLNSNHQTVREDLPYSTTDIEHVIEWTKVRFRKNRKKSPSTFPIESLANIDPSQ